MEDRGRERQRRRRAEMEEDRGRERQRRKRAERYGKGKAEEKSRDGVFFSFNNAMLYLI